MKRLTSLDFARGLSVIGMTVFHAFFVSWEFFQTGDIGTLTWEIPFAGLFFIFGHWRGFFLIISAAVHFYAMYQTYKKGIEPYKILIKQIVFAAVIFGFGAFYNALLNPWGVLNTLFRQGTIDMSVARSFVWFSEVLQNIALGVFFASIVFFFITRKDNMEKIVRNVIALGVTAFVIVLISFGIQEGIQASIGEDIRLMEPSKDTGIMPFFQYIIIQIAGRESPMFPMLSSSFVGIIIGYLLIQEKPVKNMFKIGYLVSLGLFLFGIAWLFLVDFLILGRDLFSYLFFQHVHPCWFAFTNTGLELAALLLLLQKVEYNQKLKTERWLKRSRWFRRWGRIALTVYMFQALVFLPMWLLNLIPGTPNFQALALEASFLWSLLLSVIFYWLWEGLIRLWELARFILTPEWFLVYANIFTSGKKINHKDPLNTKGIIYDVEAITFVEHELDTPIQETEDMATG